MQILRKIGAVISVVVGWSALRRSAENFRNIVWDSTAREGYQRIRLLVEQVKQKNKSLGPETFESAVKRFHLTESELVDRHAELAQYASICRTLGYASAISALVSGYSAVDIWWYALFIINGLSFSFAFFAGVLRNSFRAWQIERRELAPVKAFMADNGLVRIFCW